MADTNLVRRAGEGLADSVPHVGYLGAACWAMWVMLMYGGGLLSLTVEDASILVRSYVISTVFLAFVSFSLAIMSSKARRVFDSVPAMLALGVTASVGTALTFAGGSMGFSALLYVGNACTGIGTGCIALRCADQFSELVPRTSTIMTALMMACALVACALFISLPEEALAVVMVALPTVAVAFSFIRPRAAGGSVSADAAGADAAGAVGAAGARAGQRVLSLRDVISVLVIFLLVLLLFLLNGVVPFALSYEVFSIRSSTCVLAALAIMAVIVIVTALLPDDFKLERLYYGLLLALLGVYVVVVVGNIRSENLTLFFSTASITLNVVVWGFLSCIAHYAGRLSIAVFGFGRAVVSLGATLSWAVGSYSLMLDTPGLLIIVGVALVALVLVVSLVMFRREGTGVRLPVFEDFDIMMGRGVDSAASAGAVGADGGSGAEHEEARADDAADAGGSTSVGESAVVGGAASGESARGALAAEAGAGDETMVGAGESADVPGEAHAAGESPAGEPVRLRPRWRLRMLLLAETFDLTKREAEVFVLMAKGRDVQSIADELHVSLSTVRTHVRSIYAKCNVHSRHEFQTFVDEQSRTLDDDRG